MYRNAIITIASLLVLAACVVVLAIEVINQRETIGRYEAIVEVSCERSLDAKGCKAGIETLKKMDASDIRKWSN